MIIRVVPETHLDNILAIFISNKIIALMAEKDGWLGPMPLTQRLAKINAEIAKMELSAKRIKYIQPAQKMIIIRTVKPDVIFLEAEYMLTPSQWHVLRSKGMAIYVVDDLKLHAQTMIALERQKEDINSIISTEAAQRKGLGATQRNYKEIVKRANEAVKELGVRRSKFMLAKMLTILHTGRFKRPLAFVGAAHAADLKRWHPFTIWRIYSGAWNKLPNKV